MTRTIAMLTSILLFTFQMPAGHSVTPEQQALVDFARTQFDDAGIDLPEVAIDFPDDESHCFGYGGVYLPAEHVVRICRPSKSTMIHELAHAWIETTFTRADKAAFLDLRGLDSWTGGDEWEERGAEHAAEIVTWALMDEDISHRWIEVAPDGTTLYTRRLVKIPNSDPAQLVKAYTALSGDVPHNRMADIREPAAPISEVFSPEARRR